VLRVAGLEELEESERGRFGAKAVNLALLRKRGIPVPDGFALAFETGHPPRLTPSERDAVAEAYRRLCAGGGDGESAVAVRSSAVGEDDVALSFAGLHETCLGVVGEEALCDAVEACLASQASEGALAYRRAAGSAPAGMGVLVQRMVAAEVAGVCFTRSPVDAQTLALEAVSGLGAALVSGERRPARCNFARDGLELREREEVQGILGRLGAERAREIARLALRSEQALGFPVDFEWAVSPGGCAVLQARPITADARGADLEAIRREECSRLEAVAARADRTVVWTDFAVADMFPRPSPLGLEIMRRMSDPGGSYEVAFRTFGLHYRPERELLESICGRSYLDLEAILRCPDPALPIALDTTRLPASAGEAFDIERAPLRLAWRGWRSAAALPLLLLRVFAIGAPRFLWMRRRFERDFRGGVAAQLAEEAARERARDLSSLPDEELLRLVDERVERFTRIHSYHQLTDTIAVPTHARLRAALRRLYGDRADAVEMKLTTGLPGNFNTETNLDLGRVAAGKLSLEDFLARYGHRGSPDYDVAAPRWREDPARVRAMAEAIARSGVDPERRFAEQVRVREEAEAELDRDLRRHPWLRFLRRSVQRELGYYQRYSPLREPTQAASWLWIELTRAALTEAARRSGLGDLVFHLSLAELRRLLAGGPDPELAERARRRQARLRAARRIPLAHVIRSDDLDAIGRVPPPGAGARELAGQSVSSGVAQGRARVVHGLDEARDLEAGQVLVAANADPSWTPLFFVAGALVLEQGGLLSHPAIVARELGLPALVNVAHATRLIRDGEEILVDADQGRVILKTREAREARLSPGD
jgi:phosphohistidine swiveling domain-containing protein